MTLNEQGIGTPREWRTVQVQRAIPSWTVDKLNGPAGGRQAKWPCAFEFRCSSAVPKRLLTGPPPGRRRGYHLVPMRLTLPLVIRTAAAR